MADDPAADPSPEEMAAALAELERMADAANPVVGVTGGGTGTLEGAKVHNLYRDRAEEHVAVTRSDLDDIATFGQLQEWIGALGVALVTLGATEAVNLLAEHSDHLADYSGWLFGCAVSAICGGGLIFVAYVLHGQKAKKISKYFKPERGGA